MAKLEKGLSLDISKTRTGAALWIGGVPVNTFHKSFSHCSAVPELLIAWREWLKDVIGDTYGWVAYEEAFPRGAAHRVQFYGMLGLLHVRCHEVNTPLYGVAPSTVKKQLTGSGRAEKPEVFYQVQKMWPELGVENHDEADAVAIGVVGLARHMAKAARMASGGA